MANENKKMLSYYIPVSGDMKIVLSSFRLFVNSAFEFYMLYISKGVFFKLVIGTSPKMVFFP